MARRQGMTLIEMILIMAILAATAVIAIPNLKRGLDQRRADSAIETLRHMSYCMRVYRLEHNDTLPATFSLLEPATGNGCLDPNLYEKSYTFPQGATAVSSLYIQADDTETTRKVCVRPPGSLNKNGTIFDLPSGNCDNVTGATRSFTE